MSFNAVDRISESNPQLFKELKSRLKPTAIAICVAVSFIGQILSLMALANGYNRDIYDLDAKGWHYWFWDNFFWLSGVGIFVLLVVGTYLLIADISNEQEKGTLNLIRLSPESASKILVGKLLGVPIHLYLISVLSLPLHFYSGTIAGIPISVILSFYTVLIASCIFFYSLALLFGLISIGKGNLKAGLFSATLAGALYQTHSIRIAQYYKVNPFAWIEGFNPWLLFESLQRDTSKVIKVYEHGRHNISWYNIPLYNGSVATTILVTLNFALWTFFVWQGLRRWFHNPSANLLTKVQSYWMTAAWQISILGFVSSQTNFDKWASRNNLGTLMFLDLVLYLILIAALTPRRQTLIDWARYRHYSKFGGNKLWQDLVVGERSPAIVAMAINSILATLIAVPWILSLHPRASVWCFVSLGFAITLTLIYSLVAQLVLLNRSRKREVLTLASLTGLVIAPPLFSLAAYRMSGLNDWLSLFSMMLGGFHANRLSPVTIVSACLIQWLGVGLLSFQLQRQIKGVGASKLLKA